MNRPQPKKKQPLEVIVDRLDGLSVKIDDLAMIAARQFDSIDARFDRLENNLEDFKHETNENFSKVRKDIFDIRDRYATREEIRAMIETV